MNEKLINYEILLNLTSLLSNYVYSTLDNELRKFLSGTLIWSIFISNDLRRYKNDQSLIGELEFLFKDIIKREIEITLK